MNRPVHFEILADHPEKVSDFYRSVFDWKIEAWKGSEAYWLVATGPEGKPGIDGGIMKREFPQAVINTIEVESLDETLKKIEKGSRTERNPRRRHARLLRRPRRQSVRRAATSPLRKITTSRRHGVCGRVYNGPRPAVGSCMKRTRSARARR